MRTFMVIIQTSYNWMVTLIAPGDNSDEEPPDYSPLELDAQSSTLQP